MSFYKIKNKISKQTIKQFESRAFDRLEDFTKPFISKTGQKIIFFNENKEINLSLRIKNEKIRNFIIRLKFEEVESFFKLFELEKKHQLFENDLIDEKIIFLKENEFYSYSLENRELKLSTEEEIRSYKEKFYPKSNITKDAMKEFFKENIFNIYYKKTKTNELYFKNEYFFYKYETENIKQFSNFLNNIKNYLYISKTDIRNNNSLNVIMRFFKHSQKMGNKKLFRSVEEGFSKSLFFYLFNDNYSDIFDIIESFELKEVKNIHNFLNEKEITNFNFKMQHQRIDDFLYSFLEDKVKFFYLDSNLEIKMKILNLKKDIKYNNIALLFFKANYNDFENIKQEKFDKFYEENIEILEKVLKKYSVHIYNDRIIKTKVENLFIYDISYSSVEIVGTLIVYNDKIYLVDKNSKYNISNIFLLREDEINLEELKKESERCIIKVNL